MLICTIVQAQYIDQKKFQSHKDSIEAVLENLEARIELGNKALQVSEKYSAQADELVDKTLSSLGLIIGLIGFGLGVGITYFVGFSIRCSCVNSSQPSGLFI